MREQAARGPAAEAGRERREDRGWEKVCRLTRGLLQQKVGSPGKECLGWKRGEGSGAGHQSERCLQG